MTFTEEEESILKLIASKTQAQAKLNKANLVMGNEIRAEFSVIDTRIRLENKEAITLLQTDLANAEENLKAVLE